MTDDQHQERPRGPAPLSQAQVEALTRSGSAGADIAHVLEAHRPATDRADAAEGRTSAGSKGAPLATSPEHLQEILGQVTPHAETREGDDILGARPELTPPDA